MEHNMKLQILAFRSLLPGADSYRHGITFDRVGLRKETPVSYLALEPDSGQKKKISYRLTIAIQDFFIFLEHYGQRRCLPGCYARTQHKGVMFSLRTPTPAKKTVRWLISFTQDAEPPDGRN
jgi:hypothetical protein